MDETLVRELYNNSMLLLNLLLLAQVSKAVAALQTYHSTVQKKSKPKLVDEDSLVSMVVALKKIPDRTVRSLRV